jgi:hypothetical protein
MKLTMLNLINPEDADAYRKALLVIGNNHPYYQVEFLDVFYSGLNLAKAFVYSDKNNLPLIVMPFYLRPIEDKVSDGDSYSDVTSTWGYSGPLYNTELPPEVLNNFWNQVDIWYKENNIVSEFVRFNPDGNQINYSGELATIMNIIKGKLLDIETIWNNYNRKVRKNINKARRENLYTKIYFESEITPEIIDLFYDIYIHTMDRTNASEQYYNSKEKLTTFIEKCPENCAIVLTFKDDIAIASEIVLLSNDSMFSFIGGTLSGYFNLRPNEILKHDVIEWGYNKGFKYYVLGGGLGKEDGIYVYKKTFFPNDDYPFIVGKKIINKKIYDELSIKHTSDSNDSGFFPLYRKK